MIGSLFSGGGGLDIAVEHIFGAKTAWHCEIDPAASKVLAARWPDVPNLGDITAVDFGSVAGHGVGWDFEPVDILCGGYPCQPFSAAGRRKGSDDERHLWPYFAEAIRRLRPRYVVLENVAGHRSMGFDSVLADLAGIGYDAQWCSLRASDVGAPHRRERVFIVAHPAGSGGTNWAQCGNTPRLDVGTVAGTGDRGRERSTATRVPVMGRAAEQLAAVDLLPTPMANDGKGGFYTTDPAKQRGLLKNMVAVMPTPQARDWRGGQSNQFDLSDAVGSLLPTPATADADRGPDFARANREGSGGDDLVTICARATRGRGSNWGKYEPAIRRWETLTRPAPSPTEPNTKGNPRLAATFSEWMMGWPAGWVTDIDISRNEQLRIIGNGVVPQQATVALRWLLSVCEVAA